MEQLTPEEKRLIKNALFYVYDRKLDSIAKNHKIMGKTEREEAIKQANKYFDITKKIK